MSNQTPEFDLAPGQELTPELAERAGAGDLVGIMAAATAMVLRGDVSPANVEVLRRTVDVALRELNRRFPAPPREQGGDPDGE